MRRDMSTPRLLAGPALAAALLVPVVGATSAFAAAAPANDSFNRPTSLSGCDASHENDTFDATGQNGEPIHFLNSEPTQSVWFTFRSPVNDVVTIDTQGSDFDTVLAVYRGTALDRLTRVASDDDSGGNLTSLVSFQASANVTYRIAVDGFLASQGNYLLQVSC
jgi:hypothetical protein